MIKRLLPYLACALLCACVTRMPPAESGHWQQQLAALSQLQHWTAVGKVAIKTAREGHSANITWRQEQEITRITLSGPLGMNPLQVQSDGKTVRLDNGEESRSFSIDDPDSIRAAFGWDIPLQALPFWLKGLPQPGPMVSKQQIRDGRLQQLQQLGWTVQYSQYRHFDGYDLPTRLHLQGPDSSATLVLQQWHISP